MYSRRCRWRSSRETRGCSCSRRSSGIHVRLRSAKENKRTVQKLGVTYTLLALVQRRGAGGHDGSEDSGNKDGETHVGGVNR